MRAGLISPPLMVVIEQKKGPAGETSNLCIIYYGAEVNYPVKVTISAAFMFLLFCTCMLDPGIQH
ncbi:hypothetical protein NC651_040386 [Populus alba x Populus x berolinensis]|nr:hypothetical protein NC651_040386 [Populus alba x Populus x berolinensis]